MVRDHDDVLQQRNIESPDILPKRCNEDPIIIFGCTWSELLLIIGFWFCAWIVAALVIAVVFGTLSLGVIAAIPGTAITSYMTANYVMKQKKGRPRGYFAQQARRRMSKWTGKPFPLYNASGVLEIGRSTPLVSAWSLEEGEAAYESEKRPARLGANTGALESFTEPREE